MMLALVVLLIFATIVLGVLAFAKPASRERVETRLKRTGRKRVEEPTSGSYLSKMEDRLKPLAGKRLTEGKEEALLRRLQAAGDYGLTPQRLLARQYLWAGLLPALFAFSNWLVLGLATPVAVAGMGAAAWMGYLLPTSRLKSATERRQRMILRQLPTTLDLLTTCVEAGLSLQAAMAKVVELGKPHPLREELERTLKEIQLGRPRSDALRELGKRVGLKELNSVAVAMVQAEQMGTSIAKTLRIQSEMLRDARWQKAQEIAQKAALKLTFPVVFFIFPTIFIIIFAPLLLSFLLGK